MRAGGLEGLLEEELDRVGDEVEQAGETEAEHGGAVRAEAILHEGGAAALGPHEERHEREERGGERGGLGKPGELGEVGHDEGADRLVIRREGVRRHFTRTPPAGISPRRGGNPGSFSAKAA